MIMPTAPNIINLVSGNIVQNLRRGRAADLQLPSLFVLAHMVFHNTGEIMVTRGDTDKVT